MRPRAATGSFAGPVVLILIGVLFLLGNMGLIEFHQPRILVRTLLASTVDSLGNYEADRIPEANRAGVHPRGIGAGGVLLIIFIVILGLSATEAYRVNWQEFRDQMHIQGDVPWWGHTYDYTDDMQQAFPAGDSLNVTNERGAVNLTASVDNDIHVTVHKRINSERQEEADRWNKSTQPQISLSGGSVLVNANTQGAGEHWVSTDWISPFLAKHSHVATHHGDISVMGRDGNGVSPARTAMFLSPT